MSAASIPAQLPAWIADYNAVALHSTLGYLTPLELEMQQHPERHNHVSTKLREVDLDGELRRPYGNEEGCSTHIERGCHERYPAP